MLLHITQGAVLSLCVCVCVLAPKDSRRAARASSPNVFFFFSICHGGVMGKRVQKATRRDNGDNTAVPGGPATPLVHRENIPTFWRNPDKCILQRTAQAKSSAPHIPHTEKTCNRTPSAPPKSGKRASVRKSEETKPAGDSGERRRFGWLARSAAHQSPVFFPFLNSTSLRSPYFLTWYNNVQPRDRRGSTWTCAKGAIWSPYHLWDSQDIYLVQMDPDVYDVEVLFWVENTGTSPAQRTRGYSCKDPTGRAAWSSLVHVAISFPLLWWSPRDGRRKKRRFFLLVVFAVFSVDKLSKTELFTPWSFETTSHNPQPHGDIFFGHQNSLLEIPVHSLTAGRGVKVREEVVLAKEQAKSSSVMCSNDARGQKQSG
ncbi:hypothetical protein QBC35DRAFT_471109 [Podospora australis]|uniref:Uncharacterized protein n=1 Tax=Podospora australis TaxID=1536484 RepID=A0AAN7ALF1_9PEZI|nr:hypothetical protein QBC35DRAFT_471109 [Podospora australis]